MTYNDIIWTHNTTTIQYVQLLNRQSRTALDNLLVKQSARLTFVLIHAIEIIPAATFYLV